MTTGKSTTTTSTTTAGDAGGEASLGAPGAGEGGSTTTETETDAEITLGAPADQGKVDGKGAGKPAEGEKPKAGTPKPIELKLPDGFAKDDPLVKDVTDAAAELGLDQEKAQKLFERQVKSRDAGREALSGELIDGIEAQVKEWQGALRTDKEFGGAKFTENFELAKQGLKKFGTPELEQFLYETGLGAHPEIVRFFYRAAKATADDSIGGESGGAGPSVPADPYKQLANTLYPSMKK